MMSFLSPINYTFYTFIFQQQCHRKRQHYFCLLYEFSLIIDLFLSLYSFRIRHAPGNFSQHTKNPRNRLRANTVATYPCRCKSVAGNTSGEYRLHSVSSRTLSVFSQSRGNPASRSRIWKDPAGSPKDDRWRSSRSSSGRSRCRAAW